MFCTKTVSGELLEAESMDALVELLLSHLDYAEGDFVANPHTGKIKFYTQDFMACLVFDVSCPPGCHKDEHGRFGSYRGIELFITPYVGRWAVPMESMFSSLRKKARLGGSAF